jgi:hypothetical protein
LWISDRAFPSVSAKKFFLEALYEKSPKKRCMMLLTEQIEFCQEFFLVEDANPIELLD